MKAAWSGRLSAWRIKALIGVILGTLYAVLTAGEGRGRRLRGDVLLREKRYRRNGNREAAGPPVRIVTDGAPADRAPASIPCRSRIAADGGRWQAQRPAAGPPEGPGGRGPAAARSWRRSGRRTAR